MEGERRYLLLFSFDVAVSRFGYVDNIAERVFVLAVRLMWRYIDEFDDGWYVLSEWRVRSLVCPECALLRVYRL